MPSPAYLQAFYASATDEALLWLVELSHPALTQTVRVVNDYQSLTHAGNVYLPGGFQLQLPEQGDGIQGRARLQIENVDRAIGEALEAAREPALVTLRAVLASQPDTIEEEYPDFDLVEATWDAGSIEGDLAYQDLEAQSFGDLFLPSRWSGLR